MASALLGKRPALCASLMGRNGKEFLHALGKAEGADVIELRADSLDSPDLDEVKDLIALVRGSTGLPLLLTLRPEWEGGLFKGSEEERLHIMKECIPSVEAVDMELETARSRRNGLVRELKKRGREVIISSHDFEATPAEGDVLKTLKKGLGAGADISKLATTPETMSDVFELMSATRKASKLGNVCTIAMGELGRVSRIVAPFYGSCMVYASTGREAGPGQLEVGDMLKILKMVGLRDDR